MTTHLVGTHYVGELLNYTELPELTHPGSGWGCNPCRVLRNATCPHFTPEMKESVSYDDILAMHARLGDSLGASVVVDGSKYVTWLRSALEQRASSGSDATVQVIATVRNPVAFALSHRNRTGEELWQGATIWRDTYIDALRTANTHGVPVLVIRYEDYMDDPTRQLTKLAAFVRVKTRATPNTDLIHDIGGNWSSLVPYANKAALQSFIANMKDPEVRAEAQAFVEHASSYWRDGTPQADTRWHHSLAAWEAGSIVGTPGLADVASLLGYNVAEIAAQAISR